MNDHEQPVPGSAPAAQGMYDPANEHDACGLGFVADMRRQPGICGGEVSIG